MCPKAGSEGAGLGEAPFVVPEGWEWEGGGAPRLVPEGWEWGRVGKGGGSPSCARKLGDTCFHQLPLCMAEAWEMVEVSDVVVVWGGVREAPFVVPEGWE